MVLCHSSNEKQMHIVVSQGEDADRWRDLNPPEVYFSINGQTRVLPGTLPVSRALRCLSGKVVPHIVLCVYEDVHHDARREMVSLPESSIQPLSTMFSTPYPTTPSNPSQGSIFMYRE